MNPVSFRLRSLHLLVFCSLGALGACKVDETGLASQQKLQRDGSAQTVDLPGAAGTTGNGGQGGTVGSTGGAGAGTTGGGGTAGSSSATGGTGAGIGSTGTAGSSAAGTPGQAGASGGGNTGTAGAATGGSTGVAGNTGGTGGTGGVVATGGTGGVAATGGTGGVVATGGTGGIAATGGTGGSPVPTCGPSNCFNGCCNGNQCVRTRTQMLCGNGGAACKACGPCEMCTTSFTCDIDPTSDWTIVAVSTEVESSPPRGGEWDPKSGAVGGSNPDLFCQFEMPPHMVNTDTAGVTDTIKDVTSATWNQVITPAGKFVKASELTTTSKPWRIWVGDDDGCGLQGCVGETICEIDPPLSMSVLRAGELTKNNYMSCKSLDLKFVCQN
jgi:hypothetical protein